jgi:hypothetical protein
MLGLMSLDGRDQNNRPVGLKRTIIIAPAIKFRGLCALTKRSVIRPPHSRMPAKWRDGRWSRRVDIGHHRRSPPRTACGTALSRTWLRHAQRLVPICRGRRNSCSHRSNLPVQHVAWCLSPPRQDLATRAAHKCRTSMRGYLSELP